MVNQEEGLTSLQHKIKLIFQCVKVISSSIIIFNVFVRITEDLELGHCKK